MKGHNSIFEWLFHMPFSLVSPLLLSLAMVLRFHKVYLVKCELHDNSYNASLARDDHSWSITLNNELGPNVYLCIALKFDGLVMVLTTQIQNLFLSFENFSLLLLDEEFRTLHFLLSG